MSYSTLDWNHITQKLQNLCSSDAAKQMIQNLQPSSGPEGAAESMDQIAEATHCLNLVHRPHMESLDTWPHWWPRLNKGSLLSRLDFKDIRFFLIDALSLKECLHQCIEQSSKALPYLEFIEHGIFKVEPLIQRIDRVLTASGDIRKDASEKLAQLFKEKQDTNQTVTRILDRLIKTHEMEHLLQDKFVTTREGRRVIPIKSSLQSQIDGVVHSTSQSQQTVFMEPNEVIPLNNRLRQVDIDIESEIETILRQLTEYTFQHKSEFIQLQQQLVQSDSLFAKAQLSQILGAKKVEFSKKAVTLIGLRNPALQLLGEQVVANDLTLDQDSQRILLLSGPNAGGKTVLLKSVGLAAVMAQHGLPICADENSHLPFFKSIFVGVGDLQSVDESLSTFAGHLKVLNSALDAKGSDQLLLIDEICGSTDPEEGSALARSFIDEYLQNQVFAVITSHLTPLKLGWTADSGLVNGSLEYNSNTGRPTYKFIMGVAGESLAIQTAKRVGVNDRIIQKALKALTPEAQAERQAQLDLETAKKEVHAIQIRLKQELAETKKLKNQLNHQLEKLNKQKDAVIEEERKKADSQIQEMIQLAKASSVFERHKQLENVKRQIPKVIKKTSEVSEPDSAEQFAKLHPPGSKVYVSTLAREGVIQSAPNNKGDVIVLSQSMRLTVPWNSLKPTTSTVRNNQKIIKSSQQYANVYVPIENDRSVDLRGFLTEEALEQLDLQLDTASLQNEDRVKIIHGHGTDSLKKAIRKHLSRSVYVKKWYAGNQLTGGDGVTWAELSGRS